MKSLALICLCFGLSACVSSTKQTDALLSNPLPVTNSREIQGVPFIEQSAGHCGPATLAMALQFQGKMVSAKDLAQEVFTPGAKGSLQMDMISASRREGMMAIPIEGMTALLREVQAGHPVIVFENLAVSWLPQWHYAIVFGYDLSTPEVLMHSGPEAFKHWDLRKFERSWKLADYWGLVVLPPGELSVSADEITQVSAAVGLEAANRKEEALISYQAVLKKWPSDLAALMGSGNLNFEKSNFEKAYSFFQRATELHPTSAAAWHNRALIENELRHSRLAEKSAMRALALVAPDSRPAYEDSLKEVLDPKRPPSRKD